MLATLKEYAALQADGMMTQVPSVWCRATNFASEELSTTGAMVFWCLKITLESGERYCCEVHLASWRLLICSALKVKILHDEYLIYIERQISQYLSPAYHFFITFSVSHQKNYRKLQLTRRHESTIFFRSGLVLVCWSLQRCKALGFPGLRRIKWPRCDPCNSDAIPGCDLGRDSGLLVVLVLEGFRTIPEAVFFFKVCDLWK